MKTTLHYYYFDVSQPDEAKAHMALCDDLKAEGLTCFASISSEHGEWYRKHIAPLDGLAIELETGHLFDNQWGTANGLRVFDWAEAIHQNRSIKQGQWLEQTEEMSEARRNTLKCGYCGKQEPAQKDYVFCPHCIGSPYLETAQLHLTRLAPVCYTNRPRAPLSDAEKAHLMPLYVEAQTKNTEKARAARIASINADADKSIKAATVKRDGFLWLENAGISTDNCIYYDHVPAFCFGWRQPVSDEVRDALLAVVSEFPFPYQIRCADGRKLEGH